MKTQKANKKQRRKPTQARAKQKYNDILDASARVLALHDYRQVTMSEIHLESGHPYATIYQYFANKDDIYRAWLERFTDHVIFELADRMNQPGVTDANTRIELSVRYSLEQIAANRHTLGRLLSGMGMVSSRLVAQLEEKSHQWIVHTFGRHLDNPDQRATLERLMTATRAGNGYWLMLMLNAHRPIDIDAETRNVSALIKALLVHR